MDIITALFGLLIAIMIVMFTYSNYVFYVSREDFVSAYGFMLIGIIGSLIVLLVLLETSSKEEDKDGD